MISEATKITVTLSLKAEGEPPEILTEKGEMLFQGEKALIKMGKRRFQIEKDRVLIFGGYTLELRKDKETPLDYPTPYGTLSMKVQTKKLDISADLKRIEAKYSLYSAGERLHDIEMKLKTETEKE